MICPSGRFVELAREFGVCAQACAPKNFRLKAVEGAVRVFSVSWKALDWDASRLSRSQARHFWAGNSMEFFVDLTTAQLAAEKVRDCLLDWGRRHDLSAFEYTRQVRIAPLERPHSHPVTINTQLFNPDEF